MPRPALKKKRERDSFYNEDLAKFITHPSTYLILAGDFNCVQSATDCTGTPKPSRPLGNILSGLDLTDAWSPTNGMPSYTYYASRGASRIDRIYITKNLQQRKQCTTVPVAFTDHHAVILHVKLQTQTALRGIGHWKMNVPYLQTRHIQDTFQQNWTEWAKTKRYYPTRVLWWTRMVKRRLRLLFSRIGADRRRNKENMENFYYSVIYDTKKPTRHSRQTHASQFHKSENSPTQYGILQHYVN
jgi:hypothetical protein